MLILIIAIPRATTKFDDIGILEAIVKVVIAFSNNSFATKNIGHIISENTFMMCPTFILLMNCNF